MVGLATDYCVRATALDALRAASRSRSTAGVRGIDVKRGDSERALREIEEAGGRIGSSTAGSRA